MSVASVWSPLVVDAQVRRNPVVPPAALPRGHGRGGMDAVVFDEWAGTDREGRRPANRDGSTIAQHGSPSV